MIMQRMIELLRLMGTVPAHDEALTTPHERADIERRVERIRAYQRAMRAQGDATPHGHRDTDQGS